MRDNACMTTTQPDLLTLRAEVAKRAEDTRIARKHESEAAARTMTPENFGAWIGAAKWLHDCAEHEREARAALIRSNLAVSS